MIAAAPAAGVTIDASEPLAALVADTATAALPASAMAAARLDLLDTIGCAIAGHAADGVREAAGLVLEWAGAPLSSVWGTGSRVPPPEAAFANGMSAHALDYDDMHPGVLHTGVSVIPAAIAAAEAYGVTDLDDLLAAIVLGTEVADRIATAVTDGPGVTGWLLTPLCGYFGAAAAAARMAGHDARRIRESLGFAYVQASGNGQSTLDGALAKRMQPGFAARGGVFAAALAGRGLTAPSASLEGSRGFFAVYHRGRYDARRLTEGLGETWLVERAGYKPYPLCGWTHAALECAVALRAQGVDERALASVEIGVNAQAYRSTGTPLPRRYRPQTVVDAQFSIPYAFATALVTGRVALTDFSASALRRPDVLAVAERVVVGIDPELDAAHGREVSPARARATLRDGRKLEVTVMQPLGGPGRELGRDDLVRKFRECCAWGSRSAAHTERLLGVISDGHRGAAADLFALLREAA